MRIGRIGWVAAQVLVEWDHISAGRQPGQAPAPDGTLSTDVLIESGIRFTAQSQTFFSEMTHFFLMSLGWWFYDCFMCTPVVSFVLLRLLSIRFLSWNKPDQSLWSWWLNDTLMLVWLWLLLRLWIKLVNLPLRQLQRYIPGIWSLPQMAAVIFWSVTSKISFKQSNTSSGISACGFHRCGQKTAVFLLPQFNNDRCRMWMLC